MVRSAAAKSPYRAWSQARGLAVRSTVRAFRSWTKGARVLVPGVLLALALAVWDSGVTNAWDLPGPHSWWYAQGWVYVMKVGEERPAWFEFRNTGSTTWWAAGDPNPIRLGTDRPQDRASAFQSSWDWLSYNRPTNVDNPPVAPSSGHTNIGHFGFYVHAPDNQVATYEWANAGQNREFFRPVAELWTWLEDNGAYLDWLVVPKYGGGYNWPGWNKPDYPEVVLDGNSYPGAWDTQSMHARNIWVNAAFARLGTMYRATNGPQDGRIWVEYAACGSNNILACTYIEMWPNSDRIKRARIVINSALNMDGRTDPDYFFYPQPFDGLCPNDPGCTGLYDIYDVLAHEIGHALGIGHNTMNSTTAGDRYVTGAPIYRSQMYKSVFPRNDTSSARHAVGTFEVEAYKVHNP